MSCYSHPTAEISYLEKDQNKLKKKKKWYSNETVEGGTRVVPLKRISDFLFRGKKKIIAGRLNSTERNNLPSQREEEREGFQVFRCVADQFFSHRSGYLSYDLR